MKRPSKPGPVQPDLPALPNSKACKPVRTGKKTNRAKTATSQTAQQTDLFAQPLPPLPRSHFMPEEIRLSVVPSPEKIQAGTDDGFLYTVVSQEDATHLMAHGLPLNRRAPLMLTERAGIPLWLAKITETEVYSAHSYPAVLRLKRSLVAQALEQDPDHTAEFAISCYLLSGN